MKLAQLQLKLAEAWVRADGGYEEMYEEAKKIGLFWKMKNPHDDEDLKRLVYIVITITDELGLRPLIAVMNDDEPTDDFPAGDYVVRCDNKMQERFCIDVSNADQYNGTWELEPFPEFQKVLGV